MSKRDAPIVDKASRLPKTCCSGSMKHDGTWRHNPTCVNFGPQNVPVK